jgi:hypothetical protein
MDQSLKLGLVEQYVEHQEIVHMLPHARLMYLILSLKYCAVVILISLVRSLISGSLSSLQWLMGIVGIIIFCKYIYDYLDMYMDTVVLTNKGMTIVRIDNRFRYKVDFFERKSIMAVSHAQTGIVDRLFDNGSINISLDHDSDYQIQGIASPGKQSSIINKLKFDSLARLEEEQNLLKVHEPDKFEILVDTLSDVIGTYMTNKTTH